MSSEHRNGISVIGEATVTPTPDSVELKVAVRAAGPNVVHALQEHANRTVNLMQTLTSKGVNVNEVRATGVSVVPMSTPAPGFLEFAPRLIPGGPGALSAPTYHVSSSVSVNIRESNRVPELLDTLLTANPYLVVAIASTWSDESAVRRAALESALKDARLKAQSIAAAAGKQLGEVVEVAERPETASVATSAGPAIQYEYLAQPVPLRFSLQVTFLLK